jgi:DNA-binding transcriptional regulator YiaG
MTMSDLTHGLQAPLEQLPFQELDAIRRHLDMSQAELCRKACFSNNTYSKWRRWARGQGGHMPGKRSLKAIRDVLAAELESRNVTPADEVAEARHAA